MLNGRYYPRASIPSNSVKPIAKKTNRKPKLHYLQDRSAHVLGIFPTSEQFVHSYISQREPAGILSEDIEAKAVNLNPEIQSRLTLLLKAAHHLTIKDLKDNTITFFYDLVSIVKNDEKWEEWKREYKK